MKRADRLDAARVLILGDDELERGEAPLRNMDTKEQTPIALADLLESIKQHLIS